MRNLGRELRAILGLITVTTLLCQCQIVMAADWGKVSDEEWAAVAPPEFPSANAVYLFADGEYKVTIDGAEFKHHYRIKVLTQAGVEEAGDISFGYDEDNKLTDFEAHTIHPNGKKYKVDKNAVVEKAYRGRKVLSIAFPAVEPGCILEYRYKVCSEYLNWLDTWYFQHRFFTVQSTLTLTHTEQFEYMFSGRHLAADKGKPLEKRSLDARSVSSGTDPSYLYHFTWSVQNLEPRVDEPYQSCLDDFRSSMRFHLANYSSKYTEKRFLRSWPEIGSDHTKWLAQEYYGGRGRIEGLAREITAGLVDPIEQSRKLYEHVVNTYQTSENYRTRNLVNKGVSELIETRAGSAEEKNLLLVALHQALGIKSWPVMIGTRDHGRFDMRRPDLTQFNYIVAVAFIDSSWVFLDAASRYYPYGILAPNCLTEAGLMLDGDSSDVVRMAIQPARSMRIDTTRMVINPDRSARCSTTTICSGYTAAACAETYDKSTPDAFAKDHYVEQLGIHGEVVHREFSRAQDDRLVARVVFTSADLVEDLDGNLIVTPACFTFRTNPFTAEKRFTPIDFLYPFQFKSVVEVLPATAGEYELPPDTSFAFGGAVFSRHCRRTERGALIETELTITQPMYNPGEYPGVRSFFDQVARALSDEIAVVPTGVQ